MPAPCAKHRATMIMKTKFTPHGDRWATEFADNVFNMCVRVFYLQSRIFGCRDRCSHTTIFGHEGLASVAVAATSPHRINNSQFRMHTIQRGMKNDIVADKKVTRQNCFNLSSAGVCATRQRTCFAMTPSLRKLSHIIASRAGPDRPAPLRRRAATGGCVCKNRIELFKFPIAGK